MSDSYTLPNLAGDWPKMLPGWVWLCGAGPGDPGLLTLHALNAIRQAEVIVCDALVDRQVLDWAHPQAEVVFAGKRGGQASPKQSEISAQLVDLARAGKKVLRLKGGDPFVFGRGGEEAQTLARSGVPFRIIPGISAGIGGLAYAGIPVTHNDIGQSVTFVTGHDPHAVDWAAVSRASATLVIYMGMKHIGHICDALIGAGRAGDEPVAIVANASLPKQKVLETTLATCAVDVVTQSFKAPAIIAIGRATLLRQALDWQALVADGDLRDPDPVDNPPIRGKSDE
ncbi:MAG: uroporphyrinogen-III C-methyltransferase [Rhodobacteraceae bacterium]|nr:uroporphyrinogen-III C-methyltransferase [Paracoccaceae bacterium]